MRVASEHSGDTWHAIEAILLSVALAGIAVGVVLVAAALAAPRWPRVRAVFHPLNITLLAAQVLDGASTWIGVENPFGLNLPPFEETVFVSGLILEHFGGLVYFLLKLALAVGVIAALEMAMRGAKTKKEQIATLLVQLTLIVIGAIPVWNNISNFLRLA